MQWTAQGPLLRGRAQRTMPALSQGLQHGRSEGQRPGPGNCRAQWNPARAAGLTATHVCPLPSARGLKNGHLSWIPIPCERS